MTFKRTQVVMLPTNEKAQITFVKHTQGKNVGKLQIPAAGGEYRRLLNYDFEPQHLYILSDEQPKIGDWTINLNSPHPHKEVCRIDNRIELERYVKKVGNNCKKIIATTDTNLKIEVADEGWKSADPGGWNEYKPIYKSLPQPSESFIQKYVEEYNKGNIITDVMVEYVEYDWNLTITDHIEFYIKPKVNPKDNTITIKKVKDSFDLEELENILVKHYLDIGAIQGCNLGEDVRIWTRKWISENL